MKQGKPVITFVMVIIAIALSMYLGYYVFDTLNDPYSTTRAYAYTVYDSAEAYGILAREEKVLPRQTGIVEVVCSEGEKVAAGQLIARAYRNSQVQSGYADLEELDREIELLQSVLGDGVGVESTARLDEDILTSIVEMRAHVALGDYAQIYDMVQDMKGSVLKRSYTYGEQLSAADLKTQLQRLKEERAAQNRQFAGTYSRITTSQAGTYSSLVDGYEEILTPERIVSLTPTELENLIEQHTSIQGEDQIGKIITSNRWYFVSTLECSAAQRLREGGSMTLRFHGDFTEDVTMRVDHIGEAEGERVTVVFSSDRYLARTTFLRQQTAELIFASYEGLRVPKQAVRMESETYVEEETGEELQRNVLGVYVLVGGRAEFKKVKVVYEGSDYYVLQAAKAGSRAFRAGDEVIVRATGLQDGQLLEF